MGRPARGRASGPRRSDPVVEPTAAPPESLETPRPAGPASPPIEATSDSDTLPLSDVDSTLSDADTPTSDSESGSDSPAPPRHKRRRGDARHSRKTSPPPSPGPTVDFLRASKAPLKSTQPPPPRRLKLPTVAPDTLRRLRNRSKVVDINDLLHPRPFGGRGGTAPAQSCTSTADYLRGLAILVAYRSYFFPTMAVQWAMYAVWLHGHAAGLTLSALRELDGQGRTHLAQYPQDYHSPAELTNACKGSWRPAARSQAFRSVPTPPAAVRRRAPPSPSRASAGITAGALPAPHVAAPTHAPAAAARTQPTPAPQPRETPRAR
ncbi:uncharacterized protein LOC122369846 [Amphibalanus amphitrite]|uniref:uncharacterized protein LOC122369846 n=1 Tax=Amphibalanus amphitrite TaxID=1232801 RepID=UPI001C900925|nr:uncharacterized protein LOC122369846 [Amphibalanus amphitrite]